MFDHFKERHFVCNVVLIATSSLEQRVCVQVATVKEGNMAGINSAFHRLHPVTLLEPLGGERLVPRNSGELEFRIWRLLILWPHIGPENVTDFDKRVRL